MFAIECRDLSRTFGDTVAVDSLTFSVRSGDFFGLLGPNGAGKSTTLHMLTSLLEPTRGHARVLGHDIANEGRTVRSRIGMVFQDPAVDERLNARENLQIHAALYSIPKRRSTELIEHWLAWADLDDVGDRLVRTYSGGMKRRLELARALMHGPQVLFLDEPTLGLDPQGRRHLWDRIAALRTGGITVFMTTHNLFEAEACGTIGILDQGRLVAFGTPSTLKRDVVGNAECDLEEVFLRLTGKQLRDEEATPRARLLGFARRGGEHTR